MRRVRRSGGSLKCGSKIMRNMVVTFVKSVKGGVRRVEMREMGDAEGYVDAAIALSEGI